VVSSCERGDESSGSELVSDVSKRKLNSQLRFIVWYIHLPTLNTHSVITRIKMSILIGY
jgi:hypothetical protein